MGNKVSRCIPVRHRKCKDRDNEQVANASVSASNGQELGRPLDNGLTQNAHIQTSKEEREPLPSPTRNGPAVPPKRIYVTLYEFQGRTEGDLSLVKGEEIEILDDTVDGEWWFGKSLKTGLTGYIPSNYIEPVNSLKAHE